MASLEQKIAAEVLRERGKKLLQKNTEGKTKKQLEAERFYFWILNRLEWEMEKSPKRDYRLDIEEKQPNGENGEIIFSYHGNTGEEYHTKYVYGNEINDVLIMVKCTIGSIHGYSACIIQPHRTKQRAFMTVMLSL